MAAGGVSQATSNPLDLLPRSRDEFASKQYWNDFFVQLKEDSTRGNGDSFEWYGKWEDMHPIIVQHAITSPLLNPNVLVVGCGNSDLSEKMYDSGFKRVTSIDFSEVVIEEMKVKAESKPGLEFILMDMLNMEKSWEGAYDVIVDKGALDALMGDDDEESAKQGANMLAEIARVLKDGGRYICITLAQDHVLRTLLGSFSIANNWEVTLHALEPADGSALCPFFVDVKKASEQPVWHLAFLLHKNECNPTEIDDALDKVNQQRWSYHSKQQLKSLGEGVRGVFNLAATNGAMAEGADAARYRITVVDTDVPPGDVAIPCGVFVVPQGREHEWVFSNTESQMNIAKANKIARLMFVALGRGHEFASMTSVQDELTTTVLELSQSHLPESFKIPFLGVGTDGEIGAREIRFRGESSVTGPFVVEDVVMDDPTVEGKVATFRRLVFLNNPDSIQSEAKMTTIQTPVKTGSSKSKNKGKGKGKKKTNSQRGTSASNGAKATPSDVFMTAEEMEALGISETSQPLSEASENNTNSELDKLRVDDKYLAFEFHQAMVAALGSASRDLLRLPKPKSQSKKAQVEPIKVALIGLGGGGLASYLRNHWLPRPHRVQVDAVELDKDVIDVAANFFDCDVQPGFNIHCMDGLEYLRKPEAKSHVVIFDVDAKDLTQSLVCPPAGFLEPDFLKHLASTVIIPGGCLVVNLGARSAVDQTNALANLATVFEQVIVIPMNDSGTVNSIVLCVPECSASWNKLSETAKFASLSSSATALFDRVQLGTTNMSQLLASQDSDFLEYSEMIQLVNRDGVTVDKA